MTDAESMKELEIQFLEDSYIVVNSSNLDEIKETATKESKGVYFPGKNGMYLYQPFFINGNEIDTILKNDCGFFDTPAVGIYNYSIVNKIPKELIEEIINTFNDVVKDSGNEAAAQIYREREGDKKYFIYYPEQHISKAQVSYPDDPNLSKLRVNNELVCELHSHNTMGAFWSGTDNANEKEVCFYVVIGKFGYPSAEYKARIKCLDHQVDLRLCDIFDMTEAEEDTLLLDTSRKDGNKEIFTKIVKEAPIITIYQARKTVNNGVTYNKTNPYASYFDDFYDDYGADYGTFFDTTDNGVKDNVVGNSKNVKDDSDKVLPDYFSSLSYYTKNYFKNTVKKYFIYDVQNVAEVKCLLGLNINVKDSYCDSRVDYYDYDTLVNGYMLPDVKVYGRDSYNMNLDFRIKCRIMRLWSIMNAIETVPDSESIVIDTKADMAKLIFNMNESNMINMSFSLPVLWELLSPYEKGILSYTLGENILDLQSDVNEVGSADYNTVYTIYAILMSDKTEREKFTHFLDAVMDEYDDLIAENKGSLYDGSDPMFSKLDTYFDRLYSFYEEDPSKAADILGLVEAYNDSFLKLTGSTDTNVLDAEYESVVYSDNPDITDVEDVHIDEPADDCPAEEPHAEDDKEDPKVDEEEQLTLDLK